MSLTHAYATAEDLAVMLGQQTMRDLGKLERALNAASRQIDNYTGWIQHGFWADTTLVARTYEPDETDCLYIPEGISTSTGLVVKVDTDGDGVYETTITTADLILEPVNAAADYPVRPYTEIEIRKTASWYFPVGLENTVQVTAKFGWPAVPDDVSEACLIQAVQLFKAGDAVFGGVQLGLDGSVLRVRASLNPMAEALLEGYCKPRVA